jgi:predicted TIM-barrel fold metal-dependent hydrolase
MNNPTPLANFSDWIVSIDDHVIEPPNLWTSRLPSKYQGVCPQIREDAIGEAWYYDGRRVSVSGLVTLAGQPLAVHVPLPMRYADMNPACYDPSERIKVLNEDGILATMCFPNFPRFCGQEFWEARDKELSLLCVQAYNDFILDEWCGYEPGRFIPAIIIPLWDCHLAANEIQRCAAKGAKTLTFSEHPPSLGLPSIHDPGHFWDPVWAAASEVGMVISIHVGSSSTMPATGPDAPPMESGVLVRWRSATTLTDWLFSTVFARYPKLRMSLSEGGISFFPAVIDAINYALVRNSYLDRYAVGNDLQPKLRDKPYRNWAHEASPIEMVRNHVRGCFVGGLASTTRSTRIVIDELGSDIFLAEADFPHCDSSYPNTRKLIAEVVEGLPEDEQLRLRQNNAIEWYGLDAATMVPTSALATS